MNCRLTLGIGFLIFISCTNQSNEKTANENSYKNSKLLSHHKDFQQWVDYYQQFDEQFSWENFIKKESDSLQILPGSALPVWSPEFENYYHPLLVFSPDSSRYLDIDSYLWFIIDKNAANPEIGYSPDQEVNMVNLKDSTVNRIAFRGPNQRVEEALWLDDQTVALLENNEEGRPVISILELNKQTIQYFEYPDSVTTATGYWQNRIEKAMKVQPEYFSLL